MVYAIQNQLNNHCIYEGWLVDKKTVLHKSLASAHLILWIYRYLYTDRPARSAGFLSTEIGVPGKVGGLVEVVAAVFLGVICFAKKLGAMVGGRVFDLRAARPRSFFLFLVYLKGMYTRIVVMFNG